MQALKLGRRAARQLAAEVLAVALQRLRVGWGRAGAVSEEKLPFSYYGGAEQVSSRCGCAEERKGGIPLPPHLHPRLLLLHRPRQLHHQRVPLAAALLRHAQRVARRHGGGRGGGQLLLQLQALGLALMERKLQLAPEERDLGGERPRQAV